MNANRTWWWIALAAGGALSATLLAPPSRRRANALLHRRAPEGAAWMDRQLGEVSVRLNALEGQLQSTERGFHQRLDQLQRGWSARAGRYVPAFDQGDGGWHLDHDDVEDGLRGLPYH